MLCPTHIPEVNIHSMLKKLPKKLRIKLNPVTMYYRLMHFQIAKCQKVIDQHKERRDRGDCFMPLFSHIYSDIHHYKRFTVKVHCGSYGLLLRMAPPLCNTLSALLFPSFACKFVPSRRRQFRRKCYVPYLLTYCIYF
jgi:hypothetical protein